VYFLSLVLNSMKVGNTGRIFHSVSSTITMDLKEIGWEVVNTKLSFFVGRFHYSFISYF